MYFYICEFQKKSTFSITSSSFTMSNCYCGNPSVCHEVKKPGPNRGKWYWKVSFVKLLYKLFNVLTVPGFLSSVQQDDAAFSNGTIPLCLSFDTLEKLMPL
jgi:hypothetical protein